MELAPRNINARIFKGLKFKKFSDFKFTLKCLILPCLLRGDCCVLFEVEKSSHKSTFSWLIIKCKIRSSSSEMTISCE